MTGPVPTLTSQRRSPDSLAFSGTALDNKQTRLFRALTGDIRVEGTHTVTGTITAPLNTAIRRMYIGEDVDPVGLSLFGEHDDLLSLLNPGLAAPEHLNLTTNPTTMVAQPYHLLFRGPFRMQRFQNPILYMEIDPAAFGSAITAYTHSARVICQPYGGGIPKTVYRAGKAAATSHTLALGSRVVNGVYFLIGAASALNEVHIADVNGQPVEDLWTAQQVTKLSQNYADYKNAAPSAAPTQYLSRGYRLNSYRGRVAQIELASSQAAVAWAVGPDA